MKRGEEVKRKWFLCKRQCIGRPDYSLLGGLGVFLGWVFWFDFFVVVWFWFEGWFGGEMLERNRVSAQLFSK